jgi:hypothetical protein
MILAYIDPGAGSLLIQALIAAALSIPFFLRRSLGDVIGRLRRGRREPPKDQPQHGSE